MEQMNISNNPSQHRYEVTVDGSKAFAAYREEGGAIIFDHTVVPEEIGGRGVGGALIKAAPSGCSRTRAQSRPLCSFVAAYFDKHPEEQDLLARDAPG